MTRCWWCGVEPDAEYEIMQVESAQPVRIVYGWPPGDHEHTECPPSPAELADEGHRALLRIIEQRMTA